VSVSLLLKKRPTHAGLGLVERFVALQPADADEVLFNSFLDACGRHDQSRLGRVRSLMQNLNVTASATTYGTLLKAYGAAGDAEAVRSTWAEMQRLSVSPTEGTVVTYGCLLGAAVRCKLYDLADEVWSLLRKESLHRNTVLFSTMIKMTVAQRDLAKAIELKDEMAAEGVDANIVTYNSIVDVAVRCRAWETAMSLLEEMRIKGVTPDLITYSCLIKGLCEIGKFQDALAIFGHLEAEKVAVDEILFGSLLDGCVRAKAEPAVAVSLLQSMRARGLTVCGSAWSSICKTFLHHGCLEAAFQLSLAAIDNPSAVTIATQVSVQEGFASDAAAWFVTILVHGRWPRAQELAVLLPGLIAEQDVAAALQILYAVTTGPHLGRKATALLPSLQQLVELARSDAGAAATLADILKAAPAVGLCTKAEAESLQRLLTFEMRADATEFRPSALRADAAEFVPEKTEPREPLSPLRPAALKRNGSGLAEEAGEFGENASPNVHGVKAAHAIQAF